MHTRFKNQSKILREIYMKFLDLLILRLLPLWDFPTSISSASQSLPKLWLLPCQPNKTATLCLSSISPGTEVNHEVPSREKLITCGHRLVSVPFSRVISFPFLPTLDFYPVPSYRYFLHFVQDLSLLLARELIQYRLFLHYTKWNWINMFRFKRS